MLTDKEGPNINLFLDNNCHFTNREADKALFISTFNTDNGPWDHQNSKDLGCGNNELLAISKLVQDLLLWMDSHKSVRPNGIHSKVLRDKTDIISQSLFS